MNIFRRINSWILERFPAVWNTRLIWMVLIGLALHSLFFIFGYLHLDYEILKNYSVREHFFRVHYFSLYLIFSLIAAIYFSFKFYTHNPFRNFYPVSKLYFWKVFAQLFIMLFVFTTVDVSFENGMRAKLKKILPPDVLSKEIKDVNLAYPFLYTDKSDYHIENRSYPKPFPLDELSDVIIGYDSIEKEDIKHRIDLTKPYIVLNDHKYQFGYRVEKEIDSCHSKQVIGDIVDVSEVYGLEEYSLYNFSKIYTLENEENSYSKSFAFTSNREEYITIAPVIHNWYKTKDVKAIQNALQRLESICIKYGISHKLDVAKMARLGIEQNLNETQLLRAGLYDAGRSNYREDETSDDISGINNVDYNYSADLQKFSNIVRNTNTLHNKMGTNQLANELVWIWILISFSMAYLFIITKYINFKEILIGAVISGILIAVYSLIFFIGFERADKLSVFILSVLYLVAIIAIGIIWIWGKKTGKSLILKWFIPMSSSIILLFPLLYLWLHEASAYEYTKPCTEYTSRAYQFDVLPFHFLVLELIALHLIFVLMRKIHARAA